MIARLIDRLMAPAARELPAAESALALAALMVRIGRADGHLAIPEIDRIEAVLRLRLGLTGDAARDLRLDAERLEAEAPDTVRFVRALKGAVAYEERAALIEALWSVALADGARDADEDRLMRLVAPMLGVSDRDSALARQRAAAVSPDR
jgi:uncharacterized tellurite resistance protein B-like protein